MSMDTSSAPTASSITLAALRYTLSLYDEVVEAFYQTKVNDVKKRSAALENDKWRYNELPEALKVRRDDDKQRRNINLAELIKLVDWKTTHGKFRPFLLPQIRKNAPDQVIEASQKSRALLLDSISESDTETTPTQAVLKKALDAACVLTGVGPATGTLLLSIFAPDSIPFFQDELYAWLHKDQVGSAGTIKLKYNIKEYFELVEGVKRLRARLAASKELKAWEVEKVGFVIGHWELTNPEQKRQIWNLITEADDEGPDPVKTEKVPAGKRKVDESPVDHNMQDVKKKKSSTSSEPKSDSNRKPPRTSSTQQKPHSSGTRKSSRTRN